MTQESKLLIDALRRAVAGKEDPFSLQVDWDKFVALAQMHSLLPLVYDGLSRNHSDWAQVPQNVQDVLQKAFFSAIYQDAQMEHLQGQLQNALTDAGVLHIFLKGTVLKHDYPVPALRTMGDMDILVHTKDYPSIDKVALDLGGQYISGDGNHHAYRFPSNLLVEFHPNLVHYDKPVGTQINPGWQYARQEAKSCAMELTEEGFYLNTLCHLTSHFVGCGIGVRFVLDVWVNRNLRKQPMDRIFVETELERFGLLEFARNIENLAESWFGKGTMTPVLEEIGEYILTSGSFGNLQQNILNTMSFAGGRNGALLKKVFYSRAEMEGRFTWCKGKPILLPVAWFIRAYREVTQKPGNLLRWFKSIANTTNKQIDNQQEMLHRVGVLRKKGNR